jgi:hypothetical protein
MTDRLNLDRMHDYPGSSEREALRAPEPFHYLKESR